MSRINRPITRLLLFATLLLPFVHDALPAERVWGILLEEGTTETLVKQITIAHTQLAEEMNAQHGIMMKISLYRNAATFRRDVEANRIHYGVISTHRRVTDMAELRIVPFFTPFFSRDENDTYSLLVSARSTIQHPNQLPGKERMLYINGTPHLLEGWTRSIVGAEITNTLVDSPRRAIYPVFYGQKEACIVPTHAYDVLKELNPQFEGRLREVAKSPSLPLVIIFRQQGIPADEVLKVVHFAQTLSKDRKGQQLLSLTRVGTIAAFENRHLDGVRKSFGAANPANSLSVPRITVEAR